MEYDKLKPRLQLYMESVGLITESSRWQCPNHDDEHPSATIYDGERLYCPVCELTMDVFDVAGLIKGITEPKGQYEEVARVVGGDMPETKPEPKPQTGSDTPVSLDYETNAKDVYSRKAIEYVGSWIYKDKATDVKFTKAWACKSRDGKQVHQIDARFDYTNKSGKPAKDVITIYYNGERLKAKNAPLRLYNLDQIDGAEAVCIHEGCKSCEYGRTAIPEWAHITWNGGAKKASKIDLSEIANITVPVYLIPDDDKVGIDAMESLHKRLTKEGVVSKIIPPLKEARKIKRKGADIVEWLEVMPADEIKKYVTDCEPYTDISSKDVNNNNNDNNVNNNDIPESVIIDTTSETVRKPTDPPTPPEYYTKTVKNYGMYKILGIDAQGMANFINGCDRLQRYNPSQMSKNSLLTIAPLSYWEDQYPKRGGVDWEAAVDEIVQLSMQEDFDAEFTRGRGAWRERKGTDDILVYYDGKTIYSTQPVTGDYYYVRRPRIDVGLSSPHATPELRKSVYDIASTMTWQTKADCLRIMSWAALSPFCGALPWRPAGLLTGESGSGKSTVTDYLIRPIAKPLFLSGGESTEAGIRQITDIDSRNVVLEESEADTESKKKNREATFSLMRQSTTDDTPRVVKGSVSGKAMTFNLKNMYLFIAIDPEVGSVADENRVFRAHMVQPKDDTWKGIREKIKPLLMDNPENGRAIRSFVWSRLGDILGMIDWIADIIAEVTGRDIRWSTAEAMLMATYFIVWKDVTPTADQARKAILNFYSVQPPDEKRDQTDEMLQDYLDETVKVSGMNNLVLSLRALAIAMQTGKVASSDDTSFHGERDITRQEKTSFKNTLGQYGMSVMRDGNVAIANNHKVFKRITGSGAGYHHKLRRHKSYVDNKPVHMDGTSKQSTIFDGVLLTGDDKPF